MATHAPITGAPLRAPITLSTILQFCDEHSIPVTRFGRLAVNDPRLVIDMQNGREPTLRVSERVRAFIAGEALPSAKDQPQRHHREPASYDMTEERRHRQAMVRGSARLLAAILRERGEA